MAIYGPLGPPWQHHNMIQLGPRITLNIPVPRHQDQSTANSSLSTDLAKQGYLRRFTPPATDDAQPGPTPFDGCIHRSVGEQARSLPPRQNRAARTRREGCVTPSPPASAGFMARVRVGRSVGRHDCAGTCLLIGQRLPLATEYMAASAAGQAGEMMVRVRRVYPTS